MERQAAIGPGKAYATVLVPTGALGAGVNAATVMRGVTLGVDAIACDAGSTDSGPSYLARGVSKTSRESVRHDLAILIDAAQTAGVPLIIGSCGTAGSDSGVDWTYDIVRELVLERGLTPKIALLYSQQDPETILRRLKEGRVRALAPSGLLEPSRVQACDHIVGLMGVEPYIAALEQGADIILGGRTTDTAVLAAAPLWLGAATGPAWHAAKTAECGAMCTVNPRGGGVLMRVSQDDFVIEPLAADNRCTPETVSAHMLYENSDPFVLVEPGGTLDVRTAHYEALDERIVRVTGSNWTVTPYTMKLEGAASGPFQTLMLIGIRDPKVLARLEAFSERLLEALHSRVASTLGAAAGDYDLSLRLYGWSAVAGMSPPAGTPPPPEVGVLFVATAATQALATKIAKTCNPYFFHFPMDLEAELPTYAFPFSPAEIERGQVFSFQLNHVIEVDHPLELVRTVWPVLATATPREVVNG